MPEVRILEADFLWKANLQNPEFMNNPETFNHAYT